MFKIWEKKSSSMIKISDLFDNLWAAAVEDNRRRLILFAHL